MEERYSSSSCVLELLLIDSRPDRGGTDTSQVPRQVSNLLMCVLVSLSYCWLVRHFAHLLTTCTTRGCSGLRRHPSLTPRVPVQSAPSREAIGVEDTMHYVVRGG